MEILNFDIRGQICPSALLTALREVNRNRDGLRNGSLKLSILTDHRSAIGTIPEALRNMGYEVQTAREGTHYQIVVSGSQEMPR